MINEKEKYKLKICCIHTKIGLKIRKALIIAFICACSMLLNFFHIPFFWLIPDVEKIEFGIILPIILIGKISLTSLLIIGILMPVIDQLIHAHQPLSLPIEMVFNFLFLLMLWFFWNLFFQKEKSKINNLFFYLSSILLVLILKFIYFYLLLLFALPSILATNTFQILTVKSWPFWIVIFIKYSIIIIFGKYLNNYFHNTQLKWNYK